MIEREIVSIVTNGVASSTTTFIRNQLTDIDRKQERLNELLLIINSAIEFAKGHESIVLNSSLREWLDDLRKASKEGEEVQIAFRDDQSEDTRSIIPWKAAVRLYKRSMRVNRLNAVVIKLERKASNCDKFRQMLRDEIDKQRDEIYTERVGKLERKVARLRKKLRTIRSNGLFTKRKKTKHAHGIPTSEQELRHAKRRMSRFSGVGVGVGGGGGGGGGEGEGDWGEKYSSYCGHTSFLEWPTKTLGLQDNGECGDINSSSVGGGGGDYTMSFENARMKKDGAKATPVQMPAEPEHTPESAHRSDISFLSKLFACISLDKRN